MMDASKGVIANFSAVNHILAVKLINNNGGAGKITGVSAGLSDASSCSSECNKDYPIDSVVVLNASADTGSVFSGWSGDCSGKKLCLIMMNRPKNVNATFSKSVAVTHELSVIKAGTGGGTVQSSNISGINCGNDCISNFDLSSFVTLIATSDSGSEFAGWGEDTCYGKNTECRVKMDRNKKVKASFNKK